MTELRPEALYHDFHRAVIDPRPLLDLRAPAEFDAGSLPGAINLPLLDDAQRHQVGICHREQGGSAAVALGHRLISGAVREQRLQRWSRVAADNPELLLYCARGGKRSETVQQWLYQRTGRLFPRLVGGYKAFRNFLLGRLEPAYLTSEPLVLGGRTGSGKTLLLNQIDNSIDLEALAHHRGSSFGGHLLPQPSQADFENRLAAALIRHVEAGYAHLIVEDEGKHIGQRFLPRGLSGFFAAGKLVVLETPMAERIEITFQEYVVAGQHQYRQAFGENAGLVRWQRDMAANGRRIAKRLGGERLQRLLGELEAAGRHQDQTGSAEAHREWVRLLIREYYDPMYDYQLTKDSREVLFRGEAPGVLEFLRNRT